MVNSLSLARREEVFGRAPRWEQPLLDSSYVIATWRFWKTSFGSEAFLEVHAAVDDFKTKRTMRAVTFFVVDQGIRGHFEAALRTGPIFSSFHQVPANAHASKWLTNKPAFDKADWILRIAAVSMRAQSNFKKAG